MSFDQPDQVRLILASGSPRRRELLTQAGYRFEVIVPPSDEPDTLSCDTSPEARAEALSYFKACSVANLVDDGLIVAADTVVALAGQVYGKPVDIEDARRILGCLVGTTHRVITGVTLLDARSQRRMIRHDVTTVRMRPMANDVVERYLASHEWQGKAGAYGIQDGGDAFVESLEGSFTNVVGLPMELLGDALAAWGVTPSRGPSDEHQSV